MERWKSEQVLRAENSIRQDNSENRRGKKEEDVRVSTQAMKQIMMLFIDEGRNKRRQK